MRNAACGMVKELRIAHGLGWAITGWHPQLRFGVANLRNSLFSIPHSAFRIHLTFRTSVEIRYIPPHRTIIVAPPGKSAW